MKSTTGRRSTLRAASAAIAALVLGGTLLGGVAPASAAFHSPGDFNRAQVALRANAWVKDGIYYSQTSWYNGYRQDCSGFVSMAWGLKKSYVTWTLPEVAWPIHKSDLTMGDIMLNVDDHVVIFDKWANAAHTSYWEWELAGSTNRPVHRVVPYPFWTSDSYKYKPYRFAVSPYYTGKKPPAPAAPKVQGTQKDISAAPAVKPKPAPSRRPSSPPKQKAAPRQQQRQSPAPTAKGGAAAPRKSDTSTAAQPRSTAPAHRAAKRVTSAESMPLTPSRALLVLLKNLVAWLAD